jgi:hypothetical protein
MAKVYLKYELSLHGLNLKTEKDVQTFTADLEHILKDMLQVACDSDVELELVESAGEYE